MTITTPSTLAPAATNAVLVSEADQNHITPTGILLGPGFILGSLGIVPVHNDQQMLVASLAFWGLAGYIAYSLLEK